MTLGKPAGEIVVKSLAGTGAVQYVEIVGTSGALTLRQDSDGLRVTIPDGATYDYGLALRINGDRLP
jgi:alpha-L-fucosidase